MGLTDQEFIRYSRSLMCSDAAEAQQLRLKHSSVLLLGLGGLGCPIATTLVGAGVGQLTLIDDDVVELSNLPRQPLYETADIGKRKADVAAAKLHRHNPHPILTLMPSRPDDAALANAIADCDLVIDCSDNLPTRLQLNALARAARKPLFAAAVTADQAQLYLLAPDTACYQCLVDPDWQTLRNCQSLGVDTALVALTGQQLALLVLHFLQLGAQHQLLFGHYARYRNLSSAAPLHCGFQWYPLLANPTCPCCGSVAPAAVAAPLTAGTS